MINTINISNYRSIRECSLGLGKLNVVFGPNGSGKSNIYKAINLMASSAGGVLAQELSKEGGIENAIWSGIQKNSSMLVAPYRIILGCIMDDFEYEIQLGYTEKLAYPTQFNFDTVVKEEGIWLASQRRRPLSEIMKRKNQSVRLTDINGNKILLTEHIYENESVFSQLSAPHLYPEVSTLRELFRTWRFYHDFNVSPNSPLRSPQPGYRSPVLASDGTNLAAAYQTIIEIGNGELLTEILSDTFSDCTFHSENERGRFQLFMRREGLCRPLGMFEMSDGTLRFLCLAVALLSPRPPRFTVLNEPENGLHPQMLPALARLIAEASRYSQILLTSHSPELGHLIGKHTDFNLFELSIFEGETRISRVD